MPLAAHLSHAHPMCHLATKRKERAMRIWKTRIALVAAVGALMFALVASAQLDELKKTTPVRRTARGRTVA